MSRPAGDHPDSLVVFTFEGWQIEGRAGEPLLAALLAAGVRQLRTMPHSGAPRGGYCLVGRCTDCHVVVDGLPGVVACRTPVRAGLRVEVQHGLGAAEMSGRNNE